MRTWPPSVTPLMVLLFEVMSPSEPFTPLLLLLATLLGWSYVIPSLSDVRRADALFLVKKYLKNSYTDQQMAVDGT